MAKALPTKPQAALRPELHLPVFRIVVYVFLTLGAILFVSPFVWMITTSMMTPGEIAARKLVPGGKLAGLDAVTDADWERSLREFLPPRIVTDFRGNHFELDYIAHDEGGAFNVWIDGQTLGIVDTYADITETRTFVIDAYPDVPTFSLNQNVQLADTQHQVELEYINEQSQGPVVWLLGATASRPDGTETTIAVTDFDLPYGEWKIQEDGSLAATARDFPTYLQRCCRDLIGRSTRLQTMPLGEFIRLERPSGSHSTLTTDFIPLGLNTTIGLSERYVVTGSLSHYVKVWGDSNFSEYFVNSTIISFLTVIVQTLFSIMAAYAFARMQFPGRDLVFIIFLMTLFVPAMVIIIPNLLTVTALDRWSVRTLGPLFDSIGDITGTIPLLGRPNAASAKWLDNWPALVWPFAASTFSVFLLRQFFIQIPNELWDAAQIDGAGHLLFLFRIVVPISKAAITTVVLFTFIGTWDALEWPILVTTSDKWRPIAYGLYNFRNSEGNDPQLLMAASMIALLPIVIVYLLAQRQFTEGIATTGLKG